MAQAFKLKFRGLSSSELTGESVNLSSAINLTALAGSDNLLVEVEFEVDSLSTTNVLTFATNFCRIEVLTNGSLSVQYRNQNNFIAPVTSAAGLISTGIRYKAAFTLSNTDRNARIFLDDVQVGVVASRWGIFAIDRLGLRPASSAFNGSLYSVKAYQNGVLVNGYNPSIVLADPNILVDEIGGNNGTMVKFPSDGSARVPYDDGSSGDVYEYADTSIYNISSITHSSVETLNYDSSPLHLTLSNAENNIISNSSDNAQLSIENLTNSLIILEKTDDSAINQTNLTELYVKSSTSTTTDFNISYVPQYFISNTIQDPTEFNIQDISNISYFTSENISEISDRSNIDITMDTFSTVINQSAENSSLSVLMNDEKEIYSVEGLFSDSSEQEISSLFKGFLITSISDRSTSTFSSEEHIFTVTLYSDKTNTEISTEGSPVTKMSFSDQTAYEISSNTEASYKFSFNDISVLDFSYNTHYTTNTTISDDSSLDITQTSPANITTFENTPCEIFIEDVENIITDSANSTRIMMKPIHMDVQRNITRSDLGYVPLPFKTVINTTIEKRIDFSARM